MKIGLKIKELRQKFSLKQIDLANSLGVTPQAVSKWEKDENFPDLYLIRKMAVLFDVSLDDLFDMNQESRNVFEATVFCSSLNRFAVKGTTLTAKELAQWTNVVFHHMTDLVLRQGGIPVKYTGDGFLCFFSGQRHADRAFQAACDIERINADKDVVIFLNTGEIYFGLVGHPDYASKDIYGDAVNKVFLLMDAFSKKVKKGIGMTDEVKGRLTEAVNVTLMKNFEVPVLKEKTVIYRKS